MTQGNIIYLINSATENQIFIHLKNCDQTFVPPLSAKTNIEEYAIKIHQKAQRFEAWHDQTLIGLVAAYCNNDSMELFITNVSLDPYFTNKGIATQLLNDSIIFAKKNNFYNVVLEVNKDNIKAIQLYSKLKFQSFKQTNSSHFLKLNITYEQQ